MYERLSDKNGGNSPILCLSSSDSQCMIHPILLFLNAIHWIQFHSGILEDDMTCQIIRLKNLTQRKKACQLKVRAYLEALDVGFAAKFSYSNVPLAVIIAISRLPASFHLI